MSLPRRKYTAIFVTTLCLIVAACGFRPMYGKHSALGEDSPLAGNLIIEATGGTDKHESQIFKNTLEDKLNPESIKNTRPEYKLQVTLIKTRVPAVIKSDGTIERYNVSFSSSFVLTHVADSKQLLAGNLTRIGSYNVAINGNFATYEAEQNIIERTLEELAEDYVLRLTDYFAAPETK